MTRIGPLLSPILVGRDDLLDQADRRVAAAATGRGQFLLLAGEAGIGKTRLIASIERKARAAGFEASNGMLSPQDREVPAAAILDLARTMQRQPRFSDVGRGVLALAGATAEASEHRRRGLVLEVVDLIVATLDRPVMLWFDDLQWADSVSLEILGELARSARDLPLLLVGAYRTDDAAHGSALRLWRARLLSQRMAEEARLAPLTFDETAHMTSVILATGLPAARDTVEAVYTRTDGIPLHIEELLGALDDDQRASSRAIREVAVPSTVEEAILQRIGRLSPEAQAVARSGAVIGRCFVPEVLAGIMDIPVDDLAEPLLELVANDVIVPPIDRGLYDFRHQLLRDALYQTIPRAELRRFHARAAEFNQRLEGASEVHASLHYERAGMTAEAHRSALAGARAASNLAARREAFELYRRAVENMPPDLAVAEQAGILAEAADAAAAVEQIGTWRAWATRAREGYLAAGDAVGAARIRVGLLAIGRRNADPIDARAREIVEARAEIDAIVPVPAIGAIRYELDFHELLIGLEGSDLELASSALAACRRYAEASEDPSIRLDVESGAAMVEVAAGRIAAGLDLLDATARGARAMGFDMIGVNSFRLAATSAVQMLDYRRAAAAIVEGVPYTDAIEQSFCASVLAGLSGVVAWADGRWSDARSLGERALVHGGSSRGPGMARWALAYTALGVGDIAEARRHLAEARAFGEANGAPDLILAALWGEAEASLLAGDEGDAIDLSSHALEIARRTGELGQFAPFAVTGARARLAAGQPADAARWVDQCEAILAPAGWFAAALDHARGLVAGAEGSSGVARSSLERAIDGWATRGRTWEELWARLDLAGTLVRSGKYNEANALAADVRERARSLGSDPLVDRADEVIRAARGHAPGADPWHPLSARELEVAKLVAAGSTNNEIAEELGIARKTASAHVEHILAKLGASRRAEIASWVTGVAHGGRERVARPPLAGVSGRS